VNLGTLNLSSYKLSRKEYHFRRKILIDEKVCALAKATKAILGPEIMASSNKYHLSVEDGLRYMSLSARLEDARTARGLTLKEAARDLKTPKYRLEEIEKGHTHGAGRVVQSGHRRRAHLRQISKRHGYPEENGKRNGSDLSESGLCL